MTSSRINLNSSLSLRSYPEVESTHSHDYCQWIFPLKGSLALQIDNKTGVVGLEKAAFIAANERHAFAGSDKNLFLILDIPLTNSWMTNISVPNFWGLPNTIKHYLQFASSYWSNQGENAVSHYLIKDLLVNLLTEHFVEIYDNKVLVAKNWIDLNFATAINIKKVAAESCLSVSQLQRRFQFALGQSIGEYWRIKRLQEAKKLISSQKISLEIIASHVGYESLAAFSRSFSHHEGMSPSQWREMHFSANKRHLSDK